MGSGGYCSLRLFGIRSIGGLSIDELPFAVCGFLVLVAVRHDLRGPTGVPGNDGGTSVLTWNTGWTTKIMKDGNQYKKAAYGKGQLVNGKPVNTSDAEKAK